jgi:hypothetical protein
VQILQYKFLPREFTAYSSCSPWKEAFCSDSSPIINVTWWQHHRTKLPMAKISVNTYSPFFRYMISLPEIWTKTRKMSSLNCMKRLYIYRLYPPPPFKMLFHRNIRKSLVAAPSDLDADGLLLYTVQSLLQIYDINDLSGEVEMCGYL